MVLRENGLVPILVQLMNKAYQDSNTRHVQGAPAGYMVSKFLYILVYVKICMVDMYGLWEGVIIKFLIKAVECSILMAFVFYLALAAVVSLMCGGSTSELLWLQH